MERLPAFEIRRLRGRDVDDLVSLIVQSFAEEMALSRTGPEGVRSQVRAALAAGTPPTSLVLGATGNVAELWVASAGRELLGCYALHGRAELTVSTVAVHPRSRRKGLGRLLMAHALERSRELEARHVRLEVLADNAAAVGLYRSMGMREYDRRRSYSLQLLGRRARPLAPSRVALDRLRSTHLAYWPAVFGDSVASEALVFEPVYRSDYLSNPASRWLDAYVPISRTHRHAVLENGRPVAFLCARSAGYPPSRAVEILPPLYLEEASAHLPYMLEALTAQASRDRPVTCRLYLSDLRPEGWQAASKLGYAYERTWLYMYCKL